MMKTQPKPMTADELFALPDDGLRYELVDGELRTMTPSAGEHGVIASRLDRRVATWVETQHLGLVFGAETGFRIRTDPDTVRAPDLAFIRGERISDPSVLQSYVPIVPDLVAEVISPNDRYTEVDAKVAEWLDAGVELVWVINPRRRTVAVHSPGGILLRTEADELTGGTVLPGFACRVAELFP